MKTATPALNFRTLVVTQIAINACLAFGVWRLFGLQPGASFAVGGLLMLVNFALLAWIWDRLLTKKSIAWTVVVIVIKYTVLLGAILILIQAPWFHVLSCGLGLATFIMTALAQVAVRFRE